MANSMTLRERIARGMFVDEHKWWSSDPGEYWDDPRLNEEYKERYFERADIAIPVASEDYAESLQAIEMAVVAYGAQIRTAYSHAVEDLVDKADDLAKGLDVRVGYDGTIKYWNLQSAVSRERVIELVKHALLAAGGQIDGKILVPENDLRAVLDTFEEGSNARDPHLWGVVFADTIETLRALLPKKDEG